MVGSSQEIWCSNRETGRFHEKLGDSRENRESLQVCKVWRLRRPRYDLSCNMTSRLAIKFPTPMSGDQIPSLPGKKKRQMPGVCPGGLLKLRFDWYMYISLILNICLSFSSGSIKGLRDYYLFCVSHGFRDNFYSHGMASNFWHMLKAT